MSSSGRETVNAACRAGFGGGLIFGEAASRSRAIWSCSQSSAGYLALRFILTGTRGYRGQCAAPEKSRGSLHCATSTLRIDAGVLRLRPTKRGTPSVKTADTAGTSPLGGAERA